ncbi:MAG: PIN domain protein [Candidatus Scalindua rubra]|uniref:Ribonuclease VapC n=1 Tax=Candidatus Scalindua rubra TaxID=1872076 RepID=A0A1E3XFR6_9BACT|nr:MAG: PIN domain protein [Candidatus Scalindua rubra]
MKIVADTNTFLAVALEEPQKANIIQLTKGHDLVAPEVLPFEIGNALTAMLKKHKLNTDQMISAWDAVQTIPVEFFRVDIRAALELAARCNIYAYDAYFLECAICLRCPLLTLDRRLKVVAENNGIKIQE